jgi:hypothetical protein
MAAKSNKLTCTQCSYENEPERVYCHNCGTKLDRSLLPTDNEKEESLEKKQKRIRKFATVNRGFFVGGWRKLAFSILWALLIAILIQVARPPADIPPPWDKEKLLDVRPIGMDLEDATQSATPQAVLLTEEQINGYLQYAVKSKTTDLYVADAQFVRVYTQLNEGEIRITTEESLYGYSFYGSSYYRLSIKDNMLVAKNVGGSFGRLQVHPEAMQYADAVFQKLWDALSREKKLIAQFQSIEVHKGQINLVSKPQR